jgi:hypothetical protein
MTDSMLRQLARVLQDRWDEIVAAGGKRAFVDEDYGDVTPRNMFYKLSETEDDSERYDAELIMGLCERLGHEYDDKSLWEIKHLLGLGVDERP